ncbi:MarR family transcriptional regulator [Lachnospiraceae bacterium]|nr:MarR family transcriptional regulator [Lachnospiraceae bacterium]
MRENKIVKRLSQYNEIIKENDDIYRGFAKKMGLSECGLWILYILRTEYTAPVQSAICACLYEPKQTVNSALKKMEAEGYIELTPGSDRRSKKISLTSQGIRLCEETVDKMIEMELDAMEALSEEEQETFLTLFQKYTDLLKSLFKDKIR